MDPCLIYRSFVYRSYYVIVGSIMSIQWGSEIMTSLEFKWSERGWVTNGPDFEWDLKSASPTI